MSVQVGDVVAYRATANLWSPAVVVGVDGDRLLLRVHDSMLGPDDPQEGNYWTLVAEEQGEVEGCWQPKESVWPSE